MSTGFDSTKLIPCTICGSTEINFDYDCDNDENVTYHVIECKNGHCVEAKTLDDAIEKWQQRLST